MTERTELQDPEGPERPQEAAQGDLVAEPVPEVAEGRSGPQEGADEFRPPGSELVAMDEQDAYRAMDRADEAQILDEIQGRALEDMVYSYSEGGTKITDLSYAGVLETVRTLNSRGHTSIRCAATPPSVGEFTEDGETYYRVMVYAEDQRHGGGQWGIATVPKRMKLKHETAEKWRRKGKEVRDDDSVWDVFALTKCLSKAQRNAMKSLIPLEIQKTVVAQYLGDASKVKRIRSGPGAERLVELPPPLEDDDAKAKVTRARELYDELKKLNRLALLPAAFNEYLTRSAHSHERLDAFLEHLSQLLDAERKKAA